MTKFMSNSRLNLISLLIMTFVLFWPFLRLMPLSFGGGLPDITFERIFLPILFVGFIFKKILIEKQISINHLFISTVLFFLILTFNILFFSDNKISAFRLAFDIYFISSISFFAISGFKERINFKPIAYACLIGGLLIAGIGIAEYFYGQNIVGPVNASYEKAKYFRVNGPFNDIIGYGAILLLYMIAVFQFMETKVIQKRFAIPAIMLFAFGSFVTFSRADILVLTLIGALMLGGRSFIRIFFVFLLISLAAICLYFAWDTITSSTIVQDRIDPKTMTGRWGMYMYALNLYFDHPIIGIGFENFLKIRHHQYVVHNSYIQMLLEIGGVGFIFFAYYIFSMINIIRLRRVGSPENRQIFMKSKICIIAIVLFIPNTVNLLHNAQFIQAIMIILAVISIQICQTTNSADHSPESNSR